jgi:putative DNA primase/helicase
MLAECETSSARTCVCHGSLPCDRALREDFWEFWPTHKIILATNHKPEIRGTDYAIWRRIRLIPFTVAIPEAEQDATLPQRLAAEASGILAWLVRGCLAWQQEGLKEPEDVATATEGYRQEMDVLEEFVSACCVVADSARIRASELYKAYQRWCDATGEAPLSQRTLGLRLAERGFSMARGAHGVRLWQGLGVMATGDASDAGDAR